MINFDSSTELAHETASGVDWILGPKKRNANLGCWEHLSTLFK